jgi:hypothetical protein
MLYTSAPGAPLPPTSDEEDNSKRWLLIVPIFTHVLPQAFYNFFALALRTARDLPDYKFDVMQAERQLLHSAMNNAVDAVLTRGYAGLIAFDDDCLPPVDAVTRLVKHAERGRAYVAGLGYMRNYPHTTTVGKYYDEGPTMIDATGECAGFYWLDALPFRERGLIECDFAGVPIVMISRAALEQVEKPAFGHTDATGGQMTHDIFFCRRLQAAHIPVLVDTSIECGHIGPSPIIDGVSRDAARAAVKIHDKARQAATITQAAE